MTSSVRCVYCILIQMFSKKSPVELDPATDAGESLFQDKADNYRFLKMVQEQRYQEAYQLGQKILKKTPDTPSIMKFCMFIEQNQPELKKMVEEEKEDAEYTSGSEEEQEGENDDDDEDDSEGEDDESESDSQSEDSSIEKPKKQQAKCDVHEWPHICKNPNCPNKVKV